MTRTTCLTTLSCAALLTAVAGFGCGSSSTIGTGTGGGAGGRLGGAGGGAIIIGIGGGNGTAGAPGRDAGGGIDMCVAGTPCNAGFTCRIACNAGGGVMGTRGCTCNAAGSVNCPNNGGNACVVPDAGPPPPRPDAGFDMCVAGTPCTTGFTCEMACNVPGGGGMGTRPCTCNAAGTVNCPGGGAACMPADAGPPPPRPDAGLNMCVAGTPCTVGFTCRIACNVPGGGGPGTRGCTCNAAGAVNCPNNGGNACVPNDAGAPVDATVPPPPVDAPVGG